MILIYTIVSLIIWIGDQSMKCENQKKVVVNFIKPHQQKVSLSGVKKGGCSGQCENCPNVRKNNG